MDFKEFKKSLVQHTPPNMAMIFGTENFLRRAYTQQYRELCCDSFPEFNMLRFDAKDANANNVREALFSVPFMGERKLVEITDFYAEKADEKLLALFADKSCPAQGCFLLLSYSDAYVPNKSFKLYKIFSERGAAVDCAPPSVSDLINWIRSSMLKLRANANENVAPYLAEVCANDMDALKNEISKLCFYANGGKITKATVDAVCVKQESYKAYTMGDDILSGRISEALKTLAMMKENRTEPLRVLSSLYRRFSQTLTVKALTNAKYSARDIIKAAEFPPNQVFLMERYQRMRISRKGLERSVADCVETELKLKSTAADGYFELEQLILRIGAYFANG